jgi:hypothetical protein
MNRIQVILLAAGLLHLFFVLGEMFPWQQPFILQRVSRQEAGRFRG